MGIRVNKRIKVAPGLSVRVNKKSVGLTVGGKGMHYTVNSKGRTTKSVGVPGTGAYWQTSTTRQGRPGSATAQPSRQSPARSREGRPPAAARPPRVPRSQRPLLDLVTAYNRGAPPAGIARQLMDLSRSNSRVATTAQALAGLIALPVDHILAERALYNVFATRAEVAQDSFLRDHSPVRYLDITVHGVTHRIPLCRDLLGTVIVRLCLARKDPESATAVAAGIRDPLLAQAAQEDLRRARSA